MGLISLIISALAKRKKNGRFFARMTIFNTERPENDILSRLKC